MPTHLLQQGRLPRIALSQQRKMHLARLLFPLRRALRLEPFINLLALLLCQLLALDPFLLIWSRLVGRRRGQVREWVVR